MQFYQRRFQVTRLKLFKPSSPKKQKASVSIRLICSLWLWQLSFLHCLEHFSLFLTWNIGHHVRNEDLFLSIKLCNISFFAVEQYSITCNITLWRFTGIWINFPTLRIYLLHRVTNAALYCMHALSLYILLWDFEKLCCSLFLPS